jgi:hypothetical protein
MDKKVKEELKMDSTLVIASSNSGVAMTIGR